MAATIHQHSPNKNPILNVKQVRASEQKAVACGTQLKQLMHRAGEAVAGSIIKHLPKGPVVVLCGPGNNGGDGYVAAQNLLERGWPVKVVAVMPTESELASYYKGQWQGETLSWQPSIFNDAEIIVDALFGIGLSRELDADIRQIISILNQANKQIVAIDIATGIDSDTGKIMSAAVCANYTVTFNGYKPGHLLLPGREYSGEVINCDIGLSYLDECYTALNTPEIWLNHFPVPRLADNKYTKGAGLILGGENMTGAACLASIAARRSGAGLIMIAATAKMLPIYAGYSPGHIVKVVENLETWQDLVAEAKIRAVLIGPGNEVGENTRNAVIAACNAGKKSVLDAGALTSFAGDANILWPHLSGNAILTPHEGEFRHLFGDIAGSKIEKVQKAAALSQAIVLLKGADTVIAAPDGRTVIQNNAPAWLATAGSGDVLAGIILGYVTQNVPLFEAAAIAAWVHAECGNQCGPALIAEDLPVVLPQIIAKLLAKYS